MANKNINLKLNSLAVECLSVAAPYSTKVNTRGTILYNNQTPYFETGDFMVYGEKDGKSTYLRQVESYPTIQTVRMNVSAQNVSALQSLDEFIVSNKEHFEQLSGIKDLNYRSFLRLYTKPDGTKLYSCDLSLNVKDIKNDGTELVYLTKFYDDTNQVTKIKDFDHLKSSIGDRSLLNVKFLVDYQVKPKTKEFSVSLKAQFVQIKKPATTGTEIDPELRALKLSETPVDELKAKITLESLEPQGGQKPKQNTARILYNAKPGRRFRLDDFVLKKSEGVAVGLPPDAYDGVAIRPKLTFMLEDGNLENVEKLDAVFSQRADELREMWGITKKSKLDYSSCARESNDVKTLKLELFDQPDNKTKFILNNSELEWNTSSDLRDYIKLGTQFKNVNIVLSKVWHNKQDKQYSLKLKLKSCVLVLDEKSKQRKEYIEFGKFKSDDEVSDTVDVKAETEEELV